VCRVLIAFACFWVGCGCCFDTRRLCSAHPGAACTSDKTRFPCLHQVSSPPHNPSTHPPTTSGAPPRAARSAPRLTLLWCRVLWMPRAWLLFSQRVSNEGGLTRGGLPVLSATAVRHVAAPARYRCHLQQLSSLRPITRPADTLAPTPINTPTKQQATAPATHPPSPRPTAAPRCLCTTPRPLRTSARA